MTELRNRMIADMKLHGLTNASYSALPSIKPMTFPAGGAIFWPWSATGLNDMELLLFAAGLVLHATSLIVVSTIAKLVGSFRGLAGKLRGLAL